MEGSSVNDLSALAMTTPGGEPAAGEAAIRP
jgi:hypothetical protein